MKQSRLAKFVAAAVVLMMNIALLLPAFAATSTEGGRYAYSGNDDLYAQLYALPAFKFEKHPDGIGYGTCPVYTAPSINAYRCANGKATCSTNSKMDDAGFVSGWLLVRYETNDGGVRVGYIPPKYVSGYKSRMYPHFGYIPACADEEIYVTDNPMMHSTSFAVMSAGEEFHILSKYDYYKHDGLEWWYIECYVDGQLAYGFIEMDSAFHLGSSANSAYVGEEYPVNESAAEEVHWFTIKVDVYDADESFYVGTLVVHVPEGNVKLESYLPRRPVFNGEQYSFYRVSPAAIFIDSSGNMNTGGIVAYYAHNY